MSAYHSMITDHLAKARRADVDPRHVEAWMRVEHTTLDGLSFAAFHAETIVAADATAEAGPDASEALAASFGL